MPDTVWGPGNTVVGNKIRPDHMELTIEQADTDVKGIIEQTHNYVQGKCADGKHAAVDENGRPTLICRVREGMCRVRPVLAVQAAVAEHWRRSRVQIIGTYLSQVWEAGSPRSGSQQGWARIRIVF